MNITNHIQKVHMEIEKKKKRTQSEEAVKMKCKSMDTKVRRKKKTNFFLVEISYFRNKECQ